MSLKLPWTVVLVVLAEAGVAAYGVMLLLSPAQTLSGSFNEAAGASLMGNLLDNAGTPAPRGGCASPESPDEHVA
jgi:hypothetical protein